MSDAVENEKIKIETSLLKWDLKNKREQARKERKIEGTWVYQLRSFLTNWSGVLLTIVGIAGGVSGVIIPLYEYLSVREKENELLLNKEVISLFKELSSDSASVEMKLNSLVLLSNYEAKIVPLFLNKLELSKVEDGKMIANAIRIIGNRASGHYNVTNDIDDFANSFFATVIRDVPIGGQNLAGIENYLEVFDLTSTCNDRRIVTMLEGWKKKISNTHKNADLVPGLILISKIDNVIQNIKNKNCDSE